MEKITPVEALQKAIDLAGGQSALAEKLSALSNETISQARVWNWLNRDKQAPSEFCAPIEQISNSVVTRQMLCPNDFWFIWPDLAHLKPKAEAKEQAEKVGG